MQARRADNGQFIRGERRGKRAEKVCCKPFLCRFSFNLTGTWQLTAKSGKAMNKVQSCILNNKKNKTSRGKHRNGEISK